MMQVPSKEHFSELLCKSVCKGISVQRVPMGYAVGTPFEIGDGDKVGFYVSISPDGTFKIEDSGFLLASMLSAGINFEKGERGSDFRALLDMYHASYCEEDMVLEAKAKNMDDLLDVIPNFVSLILRVHDFYMVHPDKIKNTFRDDAIAAIKTYFTPKGVQVVEPETNETDGYKPDVVLKYANTDYFLYMITNDTRALEAQVTQLKHTDTPVIAVIEQGGGVSAKREPIIYNDLFNVAAFDRTMPERMNAKLSRSIGFPVSQTIH
jgi:Domain of unknown function DUF1828